MADNNPPELPSDPWRSETKSDSDKIREDTNKFLETLPPKLQVTLLSFFRDLSKSIVAQHTQVNGSDVSIRVTPDQEKFYNDRLREVNESGLLNPHYSPARKIT